MQIPSGYPPFEEDTILLVLDHERGKAYKAKDKSMKEFEELKTEETDYEYQDKEGFSYAKGSGSQPVEIGTRPGNDEHNKEHYRKVFANFIIDKIQSYKNKKMFDQLVIFAPGDIKNLIHEKLPKNLEESAEFYSGNFVNMPPMELIKQMHPALGE